MEPTPAPKKRDYSGRVYKPRTCLDCPAVFTPRSSQQKRCSACQREHDLRLKREDQNQRNASRRKPRYCATCGAELPVYWGRPSAYCDTCRPAGRKAAWQARNRKSVVSGSKSKYDRQYRRDNPEKVGEWARRYRQAHPEKDLASIHRRRMRIDAGKLDALDRLLSAEYRRAIQGDACFYCGSPDTQCVDHYFAIAKGGTDRWFNLVRACRSCNLSKHTMCGTAFLLLSGG
jgi:5-methylcytosine-specific restriction endonuclease McrA